MKTSPLLLLYICLLSNVFGQVEAQKLKITHLKGDFYIYTTYNLYENSKIPANGMYIVSENGVFLLDTPWDTTQFQPLLDSIRLKHGLEVSVCLATHWHSDRTEGLEYYASKGIATYTTVLTDSLSKQNGKKRAKYLIVKDTTFRFGQYAIETYYPGEGHTADNIVVWVQKEKILYGGCLIKGADASNLGFLGDGNIVEYENTLQKVNKRYPHPRYIIVSHHDWRSRRSLKHSLKMASRLTKKN